MTMKRESQSKAGLFAAALSIVTLGALTLSAQNEIDFTGQLREIRALVRAQSGGLPAGTIVLSLDAACPAGFTNAPELAGVFPVGASAKLPAGTEGGSAVHDHRVAVDIAHRHTVRGETDTPTFSSFRKEGEKMWSVAEERHRHRFTAETEPMGSALRTAVTDSGSSLPPFRAVLFCKKD